MYISHTIFFMSQIYWQNIAGFKTQYQLMDGSKANNSPPALSKTDKILARYFWTSITTWFFLLVKSVAFLTRIMENSMVPRYNGSIFFLTVKVCIFHQKRSYQNSSLKKYKWPQNFFQIPILIRKVVDWKIQYLYITVWVIKEK